MNFKFPQTILFGENHNAAAFKQHNKLSQMAVLYVTNVISEIRDDPTVNDCTNSYSAAMTLNSWRSNGRRLHTLIYLHGSLKLRLTFSLKFDDLG